MLARTILYASSGRGSSEVFQQLAKKLFNISAFSLSLKAMYSPCSKVGMVSLFLLRNLTYFQTKRTKRLTCNRER